MLFFYTYIIHNYAYFLNLFYYELIYYVNTCEHNQSIIKKLIKEKIKNYNVVIISQINILTKVLIFENF